MLAVCFEFAENAVVAKLCRVLKQASKARRLYFYKN